MKKLVSALLLTTLLSSVACTDAQRTNSKDIAIECAKLDLGATVASAGLSILMTVADIIFQGGTNWTADLAAIGAKYGPELLACAEKEAEQLFRTDAGSGSGLSTGSEINTPHGRALQVLSGKSFK